MIAAGHGGSIINISSILSTDPYLASSVYSATKGAVDTLTFALARELGPKGIRVNSILPGWIVTEMTERSVANPKFADAVLPRIPARRWGKIDDFGGIAVYLASDASKFHTGDTFLIDGGYAIF